MSGTKIGKVLAIVRPQFAPGFLLTGAQVYEVEDPKDAEKKVRQLLHDPGDYYLVVVDEYLAEQFQSGTLSRMFSSTEPVFINVGLTGTSDDDIIREIQRLAQEALGYSIRIDA
ncbi:MAG: hypothetical protein GXO39_07480 [Thermotogae bacterium]|nr:hypothetical protein [Thermotogota bacterium]